MSVFLNYKSKTPIASICSSLKYNYSRLASETGLNVPLMNELPSYIESEFKEVDEDDPEQRFVVFQMVFDKLIDHVQNYKLLLTNIKKEYDNVIRDFCNSKRQHPTLKNQIISLTTQNATIRNHNARIYQLEALIEVQKAHNKTMQRKLDEFYNKTPDFQAFIDKYLGINIKDKRLIPGLTLEQSTDADFLQKVLKKVSVTAKEMKKNLKSKYVAKSEKIALVELLNLRIAERDELTSVSEHLKAKRLRLKVGYEAALAYNEIRPPHWSVGDVVTHALRLYSDKSPSGTEKIQPTTSSSALKSIQEPEPDEEKETEIMLENIEIFNELIENSLYSEAAMHAAVSPKGILRTLTSLERFRDLKDVSHMHPSPAFIFCKALVSTVEEESQKPGEELSLECVRCALDERQFQLLFHWLYQQKLSITKSIGDLIQHYCNCALTCSCGCFSLTEYVYTQLGLHKETTMSLIKQKRITYGLHYAQFMADFQSSDYEAALTTCPTVDFACALLFNYDSERKVVKPLLSLYKVLSKFSTPKKAPIIRGIWTKTTETVSAATSKPIIYDILSCEERRENKDWEELVSKIMECKENEVASELKSFILSKAS
ncbi:clathrin heavy chain linker domain-containing protein 1-like [Argonauta hians]